MAWNLHITGPAQREFQKLPAKDQARVKDALLAMQQDPFSGDIKRLKGQASAWRRRVGSYRIVYDLHVEEQRIVVAGILRRTSTTY
ncbi:MAG: type II toxin-antitoxin system RelE/ParE family toxin [Terriglobales bacterium]